MKVRVGISGWRYAPWRGQFYPRGLPHAEELAYAARKLNSIELNGSFYSLQRPEHYARWHGQTPRGFLFAVKGSRYVTHMLRLRGVETALANFFASGIFALKEKLGPILWQLPPTLAYDRERLEAFLSLLPRRGADAMRLARKHDARVKGRARLKMNPTRALRHAIEIRHPSFAQKDFIDLLRRQRVALVVADTAGKWPFLEDITADFVYVRLHGDKQIYASGYSDAALRAWAARIKAWLAGSELAQAQTAAPPWNVRRRHRDVFVYFDNDIKAHAPFDAMRLAELLHH